MRYGHSSQLAPQDCTSSRRSTVMCALPRAIAVTTGYQGDSSSKRPRSSVVSAARRAKRRQRYHIANTVSRAARPPGGACGAPGHRARDVDRGADASKLTLAGYRQATIERSRLDKRSFHIRLKTQTPAVCPRQTPNGKVSGTSDSTCDHDSNGATACVRSMCSTTSNCLHSCAVK